MITANSGIITGSGVRFAISSCEVSPDRSAVIVRFCDFTFVFHAQWLHDAQCEHSSSRDAEHVFSQLPNRAEARQVRIFDSGIKTSLEVSWAEGKSSRYPAIWLRVLAPIVAKNVQLNESNDQVIPKGWLADMLIIPEIRYEEILRVNMSDEEFLATKTRILDILLLNSNPGILKITNLPSVDSYTESSQKNNLLTRILKRLFGSVFQHPRRGPDETFKIASHYHDSAKRAVELPNYDTSEVLLPHTDHSHYENPVRVQGLHAIQGTSENTFIDAFAALHTLREENEDFYTALCEAPVILGRAARFYKPTLSQTTIDTAVRMVAGFPQAIKGVRWHPHLTGYLLSPFGEFEKARSAHCKFQEIIRRDSHAFRTEFRPGDLYIWDNFRILHGREKIFDIPRLAVGQTVIEQTVSDEYRAVKIDWLKEYLEEHWLIQTPTKQLNELSELIRADLVNEAALRRAHQTVG